MSKLNADSERLLSSAFPTGGAYIVTGKYDANDKLVPGKEGPAGSFDLPDDRDIYFCVASIAPGNDRKNAGRVMVLVIDDVGKEIQNYDLFPFLPEPSAIVESSQGSFHYSYFIGGGMDPADYAALRRAMQSSLIYGKAHNTGAVAIFRLPQGTHTKSTRSGWKARSGGFTGRAYTEAELWAAAGVPAGAVAGQGSRGDLVEDGKLLEDLVAMIPNPVANWDYFVAIGAAIWGASNGTRPDIYETWAAQLPESDPATTQKRWDSFRNGTRVGRHWLLREAKAADPAGSEAWRKRETGSVFDDGALPPTEEEAAATMLTRDDFRSVVGEVEFINVRTGAFWKPVSVDANVAAVQIGLKADGSPNMIKATTWMRSNRYVTELSWLPGEPRILAGKHIGVMGLEDLAHHSVFNLYQAPPVKAVAKINADPWCDLVRKLWPGEADEIFDWFAHRVQRPGEKINHALVLGGAPGIGKDTVLEAVRRAVGVGNCNEIMPSDMKGGFNDFVKSVMLVINELRDDESVSQYAFYEKSKTLIAAPPYVLPINSKYLKQYKVPNVVGVVMTTNHKVMGMYLPMDDRRHLVCWSDEDAIGEGDTAFKTLWAWLMADGFDHVAAWLRSRDISRFDAKAPPRKTAAFMEIAAAGGSPMEAAFKSKLEDLGLPKILQIKDLKVSSVFSDDEDDRALDTLLNDMKYRKVLAEILGKSGYHQVRNPTRGDGRWKIDGKPEVVYGRKDVDRRELLKLAEKLGAVTDEKGGNA